MLDLRAKRLKDSLLEPVAARLPWSPSTWSVIGLGVGIGSMWAIANDMLWLGLGLWWINRILDGLDGTVARMQQKESDWGGFVDVMADLIVYAGILLVVVWNTAMPPVMMALGLMGLFYVNIGQLFLGSAILEKRKHQGEKLTATQLPISLIEGTETIVLYSLMIAFPEELEIWLGLFIGAMLVTLAHRTWWMWKELGNSNE